MRILSKQIGFYTGIWAAPRPQLPRGGATLYATTAHAPAPAVSAPIVAAGSHLAVHPVRLLGACRNLDRSSR